MNMLPLDDILPSLLPYAPGCAIPTAYFGIRGAAREFCERTRMWRYQDDFTVDGTGDDILAPSGAEVLEIESALFDGQPLEPKTVKWLDENCVGWRANELTGASLYITQTEPDTIRLVPVQSGTLSIAMFLKPSNDCEELPDFLVNKYRETIAYGALQRILLIPNQSFSSIEAGVGFGSAFERDLDTAMNKGYTGQQKARLRSKSSFF